MPRRANALAAPPRIAHTEPLYRPLPQFMVRTPLLPIAAYEALRSGAQSSHEATSTLLAHPLLGDARVRRALLVGSPSLAAALDGTPRNGRDRAHQEDKLLRYLIRMSTRPTPYGLFAGVALGAWGVRTDLALADRPPRTRMRLDMEWVLRLVQMLEAQPAIRARLCFLTNPAILTRAGRVFLAERAPWAGGPPGGPVSLRATPPVLYALEAARRPLPYPTLVAAVQEAFPRAPFEKIESLLHDLWQETILLSDLRPPLTGEHPARYVAQRLESIPAAAETLAQLRWLLAAVEAWDTVSPEESSAAFCELTARAQLLVPGIEMPVQVDMAVALAGRQLPRQVGDEVARAAELLLRLSPVPQGSPALAAYTQAFESRYGHDREVPLVEMLHPEFGIGPLDRVGYGTGGMDAARAARRARILWSLACGALRRGALSVELDDATLAALESCAPGQLVAPASVDLNVFVAASSAAAVDAGEFQLVIGPNLGAGAACRSFGRFADLLGEEARTLIAAAARMEATLQPRKLWVELVYLPRKGRSANVALRPAIREHELVLDAAAGVAAERSIPLAELVVGWRGGRLYVRWPARDIELAICAGHMLNPMQAPAIARFLSELGMGGRAQMSTFDWGQASGLPFLPRVQRGRIVLSPAQWRITSQQRDTDLPSERPGDFPAALARWREQWQAPRFVYMAAGDNRLLLDLTDARHIELVRAEIADLAEGGQLLLQEALPGPEHAWLHGPDGDYIAEYVVPLVRAAPRAGDGSTGAENVPIRRMPPPVAPSTRLRVVGSDWLFLKLYCPRSLEEDLIAGPLWVFMDTVATEGLARDWFFIRYSDPDPHLRIRFQGEPEVLLRRLLPRLCAWAADLIERQWCTRFSLDAYDREVERYGGIAGTELAEALFGSDSKAVVQFLAQAPTRGALVDRTALAVLSVDDLLAGLGLREHERLAWYCASAPSLWDEVGVEYRQRKVLLRELLGDPRRLLQEPGGPAIAATLAARRRALLPVGQRLAHLHAAGALTCDPEALYRSYVHMHLNRLLGIDATAERRVLGLLWRTRDGLERSRQRRPSAMPPAPHAAGQAVSYGDLLTDAATR